MVILELLKVIFLGIIEGITEWLPISSTGHMLLVDKFIKLSADPEFKDMFFVVIQLGAIIAVIYMYWSKLWPFRMVKDNKFPTVVDSKGRKRKDGKWKNEIRIGSVAISRVILNIWLKVIIATIPAAVIGLLLDDWMDKYAHNAVVIAVQLIVFGVLFILVETRNEEREPKITKLSQLTYLDALKLGLFQTLAIIPGTSRSGATIVGGLTMGISRRLAAEFSFFMSIPIMFGWSLVKLIKFGMHYTPTQFFELLFGMAVAFFVSVIVIQFLMGYIKRNNFKIFGIYRIALGILVIVVTIIGKVMA
ncbi:MAG: undecaprenyl-diphosphate phosphatase [Eubacterium sp.]|nr:undecaprenyl-diphosphate phosphatase [Eubacterium sp.]